MARAGYDMGDGDLVSRAEWREVLVADPDALVYQTPEWTDAICDAGRFADVSRLYRRSDGRRMVLPMVRSTLGTGRSSLPPSWGPGGLVSEGPLAADDVAMVLRDLRRHLAHILDLAGGWETVWQDRFRKQTRKNVRRATRAGVEIECDSSAAALEVFNGIRDR